MAHLNVRLQVWEDNCMRENIWMQSDKLPLSDVTSELA